MSEFVDGPDLSGSPKRLGTSVYESLLRRGQGHAGSALQAFLNCEFERALVIGKDVERVIEIGRASCRERV